MFESHALVPGDPTRDVEEWPLLELQHAQVVMPGRRGSPEELVDLFDVAERGPFRVRGRLEKIPKKHRGIERVKNIADHPLIISGVETYSIERARNKDIKIWVLGKSAWYAITPSEDYRPIFEQLLEKANLWLFLRDTYAHAIRKRQKARGPSTVKELCTEFTEYEPSCRSQRSASKLFHKHHQYLIFAMTRASEEVEFWHQTPLYQEFLETYKTLCAEANETLIPQKKKTVVVASKHRKLEPVTPPKAPKRRLRSNGREEADEVIVNGYNAVEDAASESEDDDQPEEEGYENQVQGDQEDEDDQEMSDSIVGERTPEPEDDEDDKDRQVQTRSSKGKSILRPRAGTLLPEPPASPPTEDEDDPPTDSPLLTRLNRKPEVNVLVNTFTKKPVSSVESSSNVSWPDRGSSRALPSHSPLLESEPSKQQSSRQWTCPDNGCGTVLEVNPKTREGRHAIEQHYEKHGKLMKDAMETIGLETESAFLEGKRVDNLMAKLQGMAAQWAEGMPSPLKGLDG